MHDFENRRLDLQRRTDAAIQHGGRIVAMTDQVVAETIIRDYFRGHPVQTPRHVVDVGACYGTIANVFLKDGWTADLFEPDPACQYQLQGLLAKYGARARLFPHAVTGADQETVAFHQNAIPGLSGLSCSPFGSARAELSVRAVRLGGFLASVGVTAVDFLKIDTEGNDFEVLASHDFSTLAPTLVFVEFSFYFAGQDQRALAGALARMRALGYCAVIFEYRDDGNFRRNNWTHRLVAAHLEDGRLPTAADAFGNVLFYRDGDSVLLDTLATSIDAPR